MRIFVPKETAVGESRAPVIPDTAHKLVKQGAMVEVETGLGSSIGIADSEYVAAGAAASFDRALSLSSADMVLRLNKPPMEEIKLLKPACIHISQLDPFNDAEVIRELAARGVSAISMDMMPRSTLAQKMDAISSQANLAGYAAVILAADRLNRIFPMMMTPAGTLSPARVFVIGVGVAGLQAIATARRLGARVDAFDVRPHTEEQARSLGAKFVKVELGETAQTEQGYAKELTEQQLQKQREAMVRQCALSDVVITTALVFGKRAPTLITTEMVSAMNAGSVVVDMAVERGGNVECSKLDEEIIVNGVRVVGFSNLARRVPVHASQMYSSNIGSLVEHFWDKGSGRFNLDTENEILKSCLVTYDNRILTDLTR